MAPEDAADLGYASGPYDFLRVRTHLPRVPAARRLGHRAESSGLAGGRPRAVRGQPAPRLPVRGHPRGGQDDLRAACRPSAAAHPDRETRRGGDPHRAPQDAVGRCRGPGRYSPGSGHRRGEAGTLQAVRRIGGDLRGGFPACLRLRGTVQPGFHAGDLRRDPSRGRHQELGRRHPAGFLRGHPPPGTNRHPVPLR